jgi:hypothetical protein
MDYAGAPRTLRAARRLLAITGLVALLALALLTAAAQAQLQAPPDSPGQTFDGPDPTGGNAPWDHNWGDGHDSGWPADDGDGADSGGTQGPPQQPGLHPDDDLPVDGVPDGGWDIPVEEELPPVTSTYVAGTVARMRTDGRAAIPRGAPKRVRSLMAQYNRIVGKRYKWGGGHATLVDSGYDCSGAVGYGLIKGGLQRTTMVSGSFARWAAAGAGRWVTVYAQKTHVYVEVAGLRLDTSPAGDRSGLSGVRWRPLIGQRRGFKVRHPVGL